MRTLDELKELFNEIGVPYYINEGASVPDYKKYYKYDFRKIGFTGTIMSLRDYNNYDIRLFGETILLFNNKYEYIGYCEINKKEFIEETEPTFY